MTDAIIVQVNLQADQDGPDYADLDASLGNIGFGRCHGDHALPRGVYVRSGGVESEIAFEEIALAVHQIRPGAEIVLLRGEVFARYLDRLDDPEVAVKVKPRANGLFWRRPPNTELDRAGELLLTPQPSGPEGDW